MNPSRLARSLRTASPRELRERIVQGHPIDPARLEGYVYRGTSLGLPRVVELATWKTFQKAFWRHPESGRLFGWNVRLAQDGIDAPSRPLRTRGLPRTEWNYEVVTPRESPLPADLERGLVIDYGRAPNPRLSPTRLVRDPLVSLEAGRADVLLGVSVLALAGAGATRFVETPTYFVLEREHRIDHVPAERWS